ncbi:hypothetical protein [Mangrovihabitans endophyticus]|uniref:hypothetical protein n=1 Tax=Mangrovihabitans endophyticus TaxID=1751298 RepID=UPI00166DCBEE|nr:hypothetical protein [Mangrovihabitans endophyticus]
MDDVLRELAALMAERGGIDARITHLTGRPAGPGGLRDFLAARVLGIEPAKDTGYDGVFRSGTLAGRTVCIRTYDEATNDVGADACDHYLVFGGPEQPDGWRPSAMSLFDAKRLADRLTDRWVRTGVAAGLRAADLDAARIYPTEGPEALLSLTPEQRAALALFA